MAEAQMEETGLPYGCLPLYRVRIRPLVEAPITGDLSRHGLQEDIQWFLNLLGRSWICERRSAGAEAREDNEGLRRLYEEWLGEEVDDVECTDDAGFCGA